MREPESGIGRGKFPTSLLFIKLKRETLGVNVVMVPVGKLIKEKLDEKGLSAMWLAERIPCRRANVYKIFKKSSIDTELLLRISVVLKFDFSQYFTEELKH